MSQLAFDLPHRVSRSGADFLIAECNRNAVAMIDSWPDWPHHALMLIGPPACGKTHLAHVWQAQSGAGFYPENATADKPVLVVEDCDRRRDEETLFHLLNRARESGGSLLITAQTPPSRWDIALPDLASRLKAIPIVEISDPDDDLLCAIMAKMLSDRQLQYDMPVIPFLLKRMERSFAEAQRMVKRLDVASLEKRKNISLKLAGDLLKDLQNSPRE